MTTTHAGLKQSPIALPLVGQEMDFQREALVWHGFEHRWERAHRISHLQAGVREVSEAGWALHQEVRGGTIEREARSLPFWGKDDLPHSSMRYAVACAPDVQFAYFRVPLDFREKGLELGPDSTTIRHGPVVVDLASDESMTALLAGFSVEDLNWPDGSGEFDPPDTIHTLDVGLEVTDNTVKVAATLGIHNMATLTLAGSGSRRYDFAVTVGVLVVKYRSDAGVRVTRHEFKDTWEWSRGSEARPHAKTARLRPPAPDARTGRPPLLGFTRLAYRSAKPKQQMSRLGFAIKEPRTGADGFTELDRVLWFWSWTPEQWLIAKRPGEAICEMTIAALGLPGADIRHGSAETRAEPLAIDVSRRPVEEHAPTTSPTEIR